MTLPLPRLGTLSQVFNISVSLFSHFEKWEIMSIWDCHANKKADTREALRVVLAHDVLSGCARFRAAVYVSCGCVALTLLSPVLPLALVVAEAAVLNLRLLHSLRTVSDPLSFF